MLARILGAVGRVLIGVGVLLLLFVAYQLWGTNLREAAAQRALDREFEGLLARRPAPTATTATPAPTSTAAPTSTTAAPVTGPPSTAAPVTAPADLPLPATGGAVARIRIPSISVDKTVVQGVGLEQLKKGPGHYPETPLPGQRGNVAIAGHRTTYGAPFNRLDELSDGDDIEVTTVQGTFTYRVDAKRIVAPSDVAVLDDRGDNRLTLTACHPKYSARQRIIVSGVLAGQPVPTIRGQDAPPAAAAVVGPDEPAPVVRGRDLDGGLDGVEASRTPVYLWGLACAAIFAVTWSAAHLIRRRSSRRLLAWAPYAVGTPFFLAALFVFFESFSRLLPSNF